MPCALVPVYSLYNTNHPLSDTNEIVCRQSSLTDKLKNAPRLHQHVKQVHKSLAVQSARRSCQPQELSFQESLPHLFICLGERMMCLVNNNHPRLFLNLIIMPR